MENTDCNVCGKDDDEKGVIYIIGRTVGLSDFGMRKFCQAARTLANEGWTVINPANLPHDLPVERRLPICFAMIEAADAVYALDDWANHELPIVEYRYAALLNKKLLCEYEDTGHGGPKTVTA